MPGPTTCKSNGKVCYIPVGHGLFATVDAADYKWLSKHRWSAVNMYGHFYAVRRGPEGRTLYMHREIMHARKGSIIDHADHSTLNNRRCNLRTCTHAQNSANAGPRGSASGYVGVYRAGKKWVAGITCHGKYYYCGTFDSPIEAAKARDRKAYELFGEYAYLNFPKALPRRRKRPSK